MKHIKYTFGLVAAIATLAFATSATAQIPGAYTVAPFSANSVVVPAMSTNTFWTYTITNGVQQGGSNAVTYGLPGTSTNLALNVAGYDNVGLTLKFSGTVDTTNTAIGARIYRSYNYGKTYETTPGFVLTNITTAAGAPATYTVVTNLAIPGVSTLGFVFVNTTAVGAITNTDFSINLKSPIVQTLQVIGGGAPVGTPIVVPFWNWPATN